MRGPIDYIVIEFEGNKFNGNILDELSMALESQVIDVLDVALITKDSNGKIEATEVNYLDSDLMRAINASKASSKVLITDEDVEEIGAVLHDNSSAGLLIIEHLWAKGLKQAIVDSGGKLIAEGRIHPQAAEELDQREEV